MNHLLSIILILCYSSAWAFSPGFIGAITSGGSVAGSYSDFFAGDANPLPSPWVTGLSGSGNIAKSSGAAIATTESGGWAVYDATFSDNQYSQIELPPQYDLVTSGVLARASTTVKTFYCCLRTSDTDMTIGKQLNGSWTGLGYYTPTYGASPVMRIEVSGSGSSVNIKCKINGTTVAEVTDTSNTISSGSGGAFIGTTGKSIDNWQGGNL